MRLQTNLCHGQTWTCSVLEGSSLASRPNDCSWHWLHGQRLRHQTMWFGWISLQIAFSATPWHALIYVSQWFDSQLPCVIHSPSLLLARRVLETAQSKTRWQWSRTDRQCARSLSCSPRIYCWRSSLLRSMLLLHRYYFGLRECLTLGGFEHSLVPLYSKGTVSAPASGTYFALFQLTNWLHWAAPSSRSS